MSEKQCEPSTSAQPLIMLNVEAEYKNRMLYLERIAPALPTGVTWHAGLFFDDGIDDICVTNVWVAVDGSATVRFGMVGEHKFHGECDAMEVKKWIDAGWTEKVLSEDPGDPL